MISTSRLLPLLFVLVVPAAACASDDEIPTSGTAEPTPGGDDDGTELTVVVDGGEFDRLTYTVRCADDGGTVVPHVEGVEGGRACERLADPAVVELLVEGPPQDRLCTEVYGGPQVATISGRLAGRVVETEVSRVNGCEIDTWDRLLAGFLPPARGAGAQG